MERYCIEQFRNLSKDSFKNAQKENGQEQNNQKEINEKIITYLQACGEKTYSQRLEYEQHGWEKYGFSDEEREKTMIRWYKVPDRYLIDWPLNKWRKMEASERFLIDVMNWDTKMSFANLINAKATWYDVVNEMYLALCKIISKTVSFSENLIEFKGEDYKCEEYKEQNIDRIKVINKDNAQNYLRNKCDDKRLKNAGTPFKIVKSINEEISSFGKDIMHLWFCSTDFRNLFRKVTTTDSKYKVSHYVACDMEHIPNTDVNNLLLDKMVGGNIIETYYKWVYPHIKDLDGNGITDENHFLKYVVECDGNHICCEILKIIGSEMSFIKNSDKEYKIKRLWLYSKYLKTIIPKINEQYKKLCDIILLEIQDKWDFQEWGNWVLDCKEVNDCQDEYRFEYANIKEKFDVTDESKQMRAVIRTVLEKSSQRYLR